MHTCPPSTLAVGAPGHFQLKPLPQVAIIYVRYTLWGSELARIREWRIRVSVVNTVVVDIQRLYRGYIARMHAIRLKMAQVKAIRSRFKLACIVQRLWRGFKYALPPLPCARWMCAGDGWGGDGHMMCCRSTQPCSCRLLEALLPVTYPPLPLGALFGRGRWRAKWMAQFRHPIVSRPMIGAVCHWAPL